MTHAPSSIRAAPPVIGVDIGGTTLVAVLADRDGTPLRRAGGTTPAASGPAAVLDAVVELCAAVDPTRSATAIAIGTTGIVAPGRGVILASTDAMPGWAGTDVAGGLSSRVGIDDVLVLNDVHAFLAGEWTTGAARGRSSAVAVTLGTGVGGAVVADGRLVLGRHGGAGHLGHVDVALAAGRLCPCGRTGHLESVAGARAILTIAAERGLHIRHVRDLGALAATGHHVALELLAEVGRATGLVLAGVVNTLAPDVVVVGGGVSGCGEPLLGPLREALTSSVLPLFADVDVVLASGGPDAVALGAACAWSNAMVPS